MEQEVLSPPVLVPPLKGGWAGETEARVSAWSPISHRPMACVWLHPCLAVLHRSLCSQAILHEDNLWSLGKSASSRDQRIR